MTTARDVVLERIHEALADIPPSTVVPRDYQVALAPDTDAVDLFVDRVSDYQATVHRTTTGALATKIGAILAERDATCLVVPVGVPDGWLVGTGADAVRDDPPLTFAALDQLGGVITGCALAIADTGTIVLDAGPDQGRRAISLLPDLHVCIVKTSQIVGTVSEALARLDPTRPQTWISGPSATSDIELQRVEGVHGPRRLDVIVVDGR